MAVINTVVAGSSVTASQLKDFFRQIDDGSIGHAHMQAILEHRNPFGPLAPFNPAKFIGKDWAVAENREVIPENWGPKCTRLVSNLKSGETSVIGEEVLKRFATQPLLGARAFQYYWNNQQDIPEDWKGKLVFFDATILRDPDGSLYSLYLRWHGGRWDWNARWLGRAWDAPCFSASAS